MGAQLPEGVDLSQLNLPEPIQVSIPAFNFSLGKDTNTGNIILSVIHPMLPMQLNLPFDRLAFSRFAAACKDVVNSHQFNGSEKETKTTDS